MDEIYDKYSPIADTRYASKIFILTFGKKSVVLSRIYTKMDLDKPVVKM